MSHKGSRGLQTPRQWARRLSACGLGPRRSWLDGPGAAESAGTCPRGRWAKCAP